MRYNSEPGGAFRCTCSRDSQRCHSGKGHKEVLDTSQSSCEMAESVAVVMRAQSRVCAQGSAVRMSPHIAYSGKKDRAAELARSFTLVFLDSALLNLFN